MLLVDSDSLSRPCGPTANDLVEAAGCGHVGCRTDASPDCDRAAGRRPVDQMAARGPKQRRCQPRRCCRTLLLSDRSGHVGDQDVSAQIVQPSDALGATDPLAQRTLPRSASKHPNCRSRAGAGVDHVDHIAAELERHQPPPGRGRDCWFVAHAAVSARLPLFAWSGSPANMAAPGVER